MQNRDLTRGNALRNIISFALPYMLAMFLQILYGMADMLIIGQYCGVDTITAVSNGAQVMNMIAVVLLGLTVGTTVLIARAVGAQKLDSAGQIIGNTISLFLVLSVVLAAILLFLRTDLVRWLDVPSEAVGETITYLTLCFIGIPFILGYDVIASIYRGLGDSKRPLYFIAIACVTNIILDIVFIGYMHLGAAGAALGTIASQLASVVVAWWSIRKHQIVARLRLIDLRFKRSVLGSLLKVGLPISLQEGFIQLSFIAIMIIANHRGMTDSAAVGIVEKFIGLLFIIPSAMLASVSTIVHALHSGTPFSSPPRSALSWRSPCSFSRSISLRCLRATWLLLAQGQNICEALCGTVCLQEFISVLVASLRPWGSRFSLLGTTSYRSY